jgi:hypothetical protein
MRKSHVILAIFLALLVGMQIVHYSEPRPVQAQTSGHKSKYVSTATTTAVSDGSGFFNSITINGGTAGVVTLFDVAAASCTGTPGSGKFATIETIGATSPVTLFYEQRIVNGFCIVTAAATDLTVNFD